MSTPGSTTAWRSCTPSRRPTSSSSRSTCVSGNTDARQVAINTLAVLELAGRTDVEVAIGREVPLVRPLETTPETHGPTGLGYAELPPPSRAVSDRHGVDVILEEARRRPGEIDLVTLGPLTNVAVALEREPALPRLLRGLTVMGGAFGVPGQHHARRPSGTSTAIRRRRASSSGPGATRSPRTPAIPRPLVLGLDVTERARILPEHVVRLARRAGSTPDDSIALGRGEDPMIATRSVASDPIVRFIADALRFYMEFHARYDGFYGAFIHDPLAVAAALDRSLVTTEALYVDVETTRRADDRDDRRGPAADHGQGTEPRRRRRRPTPTTFLDRLIERVGGLAAPPTCHASWHG